MKKFFICISVLLLLLVISGHTSAAAAQSWPMSQCQQLVPYGLPRDTHAHVVQICRHAYVLETDTVSKIPVWVAYTLIPSHTTGCIARSNSFVADETLPVGQRAELHDYAHNGYDMGHQADAADMSWDATAERESFILTNAAPQTPELNRGSWKVLETAVRAWAHAGHAITIYVGSIYSASDAAIGADHVTVPHAFYKIVVDNYTHRSLAFVMQNLKTDQGNDLGKFQTTVSDIERQTGVVFNVPDNKAAKNTIWPYDITRLATDRRAACAR